jgi:hypothetical protein
MLVEIVGSVSCLQLGQLQVQASLQISQHLARLIENAPSRFLKLLHFSIHSAQLPHGRLECAQTIVILIISQDSNTSGQIVCNFHSVLEKLVRLAKATQGLLHNRIVSATARLASEH